jgi:hypothetical protein
MLGEFLDTIFPISSKIFGDLEKKCGDFAHGIIIST